MQNLRQHALHREIIRVKDCVSRSYGGLVMRIAASGHRQPFHLGEFKGLPVVALQGRRSVENFQRVDRDLFQDVLPDSRAE